MSTPTYPKGRQVGVWEEREREISLFQKLDVGDAGRWLE
jgi:hypothetical protein